MKHIPAVTKTELVEFTGPIKVGDIVRIHDFSYMARFDISSSEHLESWCADFPGRKNIKLGDDFEVVELNLRMPSPAFNKAVQRRTSAKFEYLDTMVKDKTGNYWMTQKRFLTRPAVETTVILEPAKMILEEGDKVKWSDYNYALLLATEAPSYPAWYRINPSKVVEPWDTFQIFKLGLKVPAISDNGILEWSKGEIGTEVEIVYLDAMILDKKNHYWLTCEKYLHFTVE